MMPVRLRDGSRQPHARMRRQDGFDGCNVRLRRELHGRGRLLAAWPADAYLERRRGIGRSRADHEASFGVRAPEGAVHALDQPTSPIRNVEYGELRVGHGSAITADGSDDDVP